MRIFWGAMMAILLAGAMAFAQDYQASPPSQDVDNGAPAVAPDNSYQPAPSQTYAEPAQQEQNEAPVEAAPQSSEGVTVEGAQSERGGGVTIEGNAAAQSKQSMEGVEAVHYDISHLAKEERGSLLPDEPYDHVSGTLSSWDTDPTGVYKDSRRTTGSPFPLAAAPAIDLGKPSLLPNREELPTAMSGNLSSWDTAPTAVYKDSGLITGSPFPMSAAPPIRMGHSLLGSVDEGADFNNMAPFPDTASPMPTAGAPARRGWLKQVQ